jgi:hypothetical protein
MATVCIGSRAISCIGILLKRHALNAPPPPRRQVACGGPLVVCGDLNSLPGSDCHALFAAGAVSHTCPQPPADLRPPPSRPLLPAEEPPAGGSEAFAQPLRLRPAYDPPPVGVYLSLGTLAHSDKPL